MTFKNIPTWAQWQSVRGPKPVPPIPGSLVKSPLYRIDELIQKYHQVFDMSKLNILMELKNAITDWAAASLAGSAPSASRLEAMQALMEIVIRKLHELDGWGKHRYLKATCLAYEIATGAYDENKVPGGPYAKPEDVPPPGQLAKTRQRDETAEIAGRVTKMRNAIAAAYTGYQSYRATESIPDDEDRKTLKIFMAPEFFFRGPYGAYRDIGWNAKILSMLRTETSKTQYADWLFVHGSALFSTDKMVNNVKVGNLLENYALVQKGGPKTSEHHDIIIAKEFPSHVDFKHPGVGDLQWFDPATTRAKVGGFDQRNFMPEGGRTDPIHGSTPSEVLDANTPSASELVGGTIFTMDGILFGLEVCRDHLIGRLAHSHESGKVQIQLVPSCGASIETASISCINGGIVFNCDGDVDSGPDSAVRVNSGGGGTGIAGTYHDAGDGNKIAIFETQRIPWPGAVPANVAQQLKLMASVVSGTAPIPPPRPNRN
ncbi:MAG TPA: hypothetical protein VL523_18315 [Terriglobia bacterium]|nr:hypothetical protein [Terriglobia bacterium]